MSAADKVSESLLGLLRQGSWFAGLPDELQRLIVAHSKVESFRRGQVISRQGARSRGLFVVIEGQVRAVRDLDAANPAVFHVAGPGFWFGEIAALAGLPAAVTFVAAGPVKLMLLPVRRVDEIVDDNPRYYKDLARLAIERYAVVVRQVVEMAALSAGMRLRFRLAQLAELRQLDDKRSGPNVIRIPQGELAQMIGVSRQHVNRMLHQLEAAKVIALPPRRIVILDFARLCSPADIEMERGKPRRPSGS